eukprot:4053973-Amphidinium_carterae.1
MRPHHDVAQCRPHANLPSNSKLTAQEFSSRPTSFAQNTDCSHMFVSVVDKPNQAEKNLELRIND